MHLQKFILFVFQVFIAKFCNFKLKIADKVLIIDVWKHENMKLNTVYIIIVLIIT